MRIATRALILGALGLAAATADAQIARHFYGAKFEPVDGIIHGAGQTYYLGGPHYTAFDRYNDVLGASHYPLLYMDYGNWMDTAPFYDNLRNNLESFQTTDNKYVVAQLGLVLPTGTTLLTQGQLDAIAAGLASLNRPVYFRPGYEANGPWNNLNPATFISNFRTISDRVEADGLDVAMVWNVVVGDGGGYSTWANAQQYYPGDAYVDWWSFNVFGPVAFTPGQQAQWTQFLNAAHAAGKPVLIGEATPQGEGADQANDWNVWFDPFFDLIEDNPGIKAHTYINWDWTTTCACNGWRWWGDARLETGDATVVSNYIERIANPIYIHATDSIPDFMTEQLPCEADVTTQGAGVSDPLYGEPDGQVTAADINYFVNNWILGGTQADVTTQGAGVGDPGYGVPDGNVTGADINYYVNLWVAGCP